METPNTRVSTSFNSIFVLFWFHKILNSSVHISQCYMKNITLLTPLIFLPKILLTCSLDMWSGKTDYFGFHLSASSYLLSVYKFCGNKYIKVFSHFCLLIYSRFYPITIYAIQRDPYVVYVLLECCGYIIMYFTTRYED